MRECIKTNRLVFLYEFFFIDSSISNVFLGQRIIAMSWRDVYIFLFCFIVARMHVSWEMRSFTTVLKSYREMKKSFTLKFSLVKSHTLMST